MLNERLKIGLQYLLPQHLLSRIVKYMSECSLTAWKNFSIKLFIRVFDVDVSEAKQTEPTAYPNLQQFFLRELREEARPIVQGDALIASPVDGLISQRGEIAEKNLLQAKGVDYCLQQLLGGDATRARPFHHGSFTTIYLGPSDYHRVHMPVTGTLREMVFVPGRLFSVNPLTVENVPRLFARNERVIAIFDTKFGPMAMVLVGAMLVASIATQWAGVIAPRRPRKMTRWTYTDADNICLQKGEQMGHFQFGSTVIVLFPENTIDFSDNVSPGLHIKMGERLAQVKSV